MCCDLQVHPFGTSSPTYGARHESLLPMTRDYSKFFPQHTSQAPSKPLLSLLDALGWQPLFAQQTDTDEMTDLAPVRIVEVHRSGLHVLGADLDDTLPPRHDLTVGDWLMVRRDDLSIARVLERKSLLRRRAAGLERQAQLIAANVDTAFIVTSCNEDFNVARLERYLALAFDADITPVIVLTKADLVPDPHSFLDQATAISDQVAVVALDARGSEPKTKLAHWCKPRATVAFLGSSGVGKSTLSNAMLGSQSIETQSIREGDAKGRHTTTRRQLHQAPEGYLVLDTPGMRELQLTDVASGIEDVFADLSALATHCKFNDCSHETEPGCAVLKAIEDGEVDPVRFARWRKLMAEDAFNSASLAERRANDKAFGKMVRKITKSKNKRR